MVRIIPENPMLKTLALVLALLAALIFGGRAEAALQADGDAVPVMVYVTNTDDADGDGLSDAVEALLGTDALSQDTDDDGMPDGWEVRNALNPLDTWDATYDADEDGLLNVEEFAAGARPFEEDTDADGYWDSVEWDLGTDLLAHESRPVRSCLSDVNCDGRVDAIDVQLVVNGALGCRTRVPVDITGAKAVDSVDIQTVINAAIGLTQT